jgi:hypothetical protein
VSALLQFCSRGKPIPATNGFAGGDVFRFATLFLTLVACAASLDLWAFCTRASCGRSRFADAPLSADSISLGLIGSPFRDSSTAGPAVIGAASTGWMVAAPAAGLAPVSG